MADMEVLDPGGHQHLVGKIKEQLAMKADAAMSDAVDKVARNQVTREVEGELVSVEDACGAPMLSLGVDGKSTQNGTPTPDAPVEIVSVNEPSLIIAGKNLCPTADGTTIASDWIRDGQNYFKYIGLTVENATLTLSCNMAAAPSVISTSNNRLYVTIPGAQSKFCDLNTAGAKSVTVSGSGIVRLGINRNAIDSNGVDTLLKNIQLEIGSTATAYEPYATTTVPLYDGTLRSLPNGTRDTLALTYLRPSTREGWAWYGRELVQMVGHVADMGELAWSYGSTYMGFYAHMTDISTVEITDTVLRCTGYNALPNATIGQIGNMEDKSITQRRTYDAVWVKDADYTDAADFTAAVSGMQLDYPLATPVTTTLDPIELPVLPAPNAIVYSDPATGLAIEYVRDTQIVIDSLYAEIDRAHAAIAPVEHGTSSANYAVGSYLMLDGTFCKVTSAIATGETIAIGTNVVATTVDAELASLA